MATMVIMARALQSLGPDNQRPGSYFRCGQVFTPEWADHVIDESNLAEIQADPWIEVKMLDDAEQARRKRAAYDAAAKAADAAEANAAALRSQAEALRAEADEALAKADGKVAAPVAAPAPTPFRDALLAAMPGESRAKLAELEASAAAEQAPETKAPAKRK